MVKKTAMELGQMLSEEKEKLKQQQKARDDLAQAVIKGREQKQARSDDAKRKILMGAYLLKKHDNDIKKIVRKIFFFF
ncbi:mobilization protein [Acinetobacter baumannii]